MLHYTYHMHTVHVSTECKDAYYVSTEIEHDVKELRMDGKR